MSTDASTLNPLEIKVRDIFVAKLGEKAQIIRIEQKNDRVAVRIISPTHYVWAKEASVQAATDAGRATGLDINVNLTIIR